VTRGERRETRGREKVREQPHGAPHPEQSEGSSPPCSALSRATQREVSSLAGQIPQALCALGWRGLSPAAFLPPIAPAVILSACSSPSHANMARAVPPSRGWSRTDWVGRSLTMKLSIKSPSVRDSRVPRPPSMTNESQALSSAWLVRWLRLRRNSYCRKPESRPNWKSRTWCE